MLKQGGEAMSVSTESSKAREEEACDLADRRCVPCRGGTPPLGPEEQRALLARISTEWKVVDGHHLERTWRFDDFRQALAFTNQVGELAEAEGHHPDILLGWGRVLVTLFTHRAGGLTESDFVLAAKIDRLR
jgi:4a-hydroxytetrahydrobiopterin dehydratase